MSTPNQKRVFVNCVIAYSILFFPWWYTALFILIGFFLLQFFYEGIVYAFLFDMLYAPAFWHGFEFEAWGGFLALISFLLITYIKIRMRPFP